MDISAKYILLTHLPLLQGLGGKELAQIEHTLRLDVEEMSSVRIPIIKQGEFCNHLIFLINGRLRREQVSNDGVYTVTSYIEGQTIIEPSSLYGIECRYQYTYFVDDKVQFICIRKSDVGSTLMKYDIFRINYLNTLSTDIHKKQVLIQPSAFNTTTDKVLHFLKSCTIDCPSSADIRIKMTDIAAYVSETRLQVSRALNKLEEQGIIQLCRNKIIIPDTQKLRTE